MNDKQNIRLLFIKWGREFNEPIMTEQDVVIYCKRISKYDFTPEELAAGIEMYAETFQYGQRRNWATLLECCNKIRNINMNIMPAGIAADHFVAHFGYEDFQRLAVREGYDPISANIADSVVNALGIGIGQEEPKYVRMKFMSLYKELVDSYMSVEGQAAKQLGDRVKEQKRLPVDINKVAAEMRKLEESKRP